jgi:hypothetical protein
MNTNAASLRPSVLKSLWQVGRVVPNPPRLGTVIAAAAMAAAMVLTSGRAQDQTVSGNLTVTGSASVNTTTASTSKDTGALVVEGGVGVEGDVNAGGSISATSIIATSGSISTGAGQNLTLSGGTNGASLALGQGASGVVNLKAGGSGAATISSAPHLRVPAIRSSAACAGSRNCGDCRWEYRVG